MAAMGADSPAAGPGREFTVASVRSVAAEFQGQLSGGLQGHNECSVPASDTQPSALSTTASQYLVFFIRRLDLHPTPATRPHA